MKTVFADSQYWIAVTNPRDPWREPALQAKRKLGGTTIVTTDEVLGEFLTGMSGGGPALRHKAVQIVRAVLTNPDVRVIPQSRESFLSATDRYAARSDKGYSFTDCAAMNVMDAVGITDILTNDHHFAQEGYVVLFNLPTR